MKCSLPISVIVDKLVLNKGDICNTNVYNMTHSKHFCASKIKFRALSHWLSLNFS